MVVFSGTDTGKIRKTNQDAFYSDFLPDKSAFIVVCDGMGGANAGNVASQLAIKTITEYINNSYSVRLDKFALMDIMKNAVLSANFKIYEKSAENPEFFGMGTTAVVLIVRNGLAFICHVGDSRAYLINSEIKQLTKDHSVVQSLLEDGTLTPEEAKNHPDKNVITRALGVEKSLLPDLTELPVEIGDTILVCTDGLSNFADDKEIFEIVKSNSPEDVIKILIDTANKNGGRDNITAVTVTL